MAATKSIKHILELLQLAWRRRVLVDGLLSLTIGIGAAIGIATLGAHWEYPEWAAWSSLLFPMTALAAFAIRLTSNERAALVSLEGTARQAELLAPELGSAAASALEFEQYLNQKSNDQIGASRDLLVTHIAETRRHLNAVKFPLRLKNRYSRRRQQLLTGSIATLIVGLAIFTLLDTGRVRLRGLLQPGGRTITRDAPLAADIRITYQYPAYTKLPSSVVEGGDGTIRTLVGTQITLKAVTDEPVEHAEIVLLSQDGVRERSIQVSIQDKRHMLASFAVLRSGSYRFVLTTASGDRLEEAKNHLIIAQPDEYPEIRMTTPRVDVEVRDNERVPIRWQARDDFGVATVNLVFEGEQSQQTLRIPLTEEKTNKRKAGSYAWTIGLADFKRSHRGRFYLEAIDNDTIHGPKRSVSNSLTLKLFNAKTFHHDIGERQQKSLHKLVTLLAHELENPITATSPKQPRLTEIQKNLLPLLATASDFLELLLVDMRADRLGNPDIIGIFQNIHENLNLLTQRRNKLLTQLLANQSPKQTRSAIRVAQSQDIRQLENDISYLDDALALKRIADLKDAAQDLIAAQRELGDLLESYKQTQSPELREALQNKIEKLRDEMLRLLMEMGKIKQSLPGEYRNIEAATMLQMDSQLNRLEQLLRDGDLEAAAAELEQFANMIENMMEGLTEAEDEFGSETYREVRQQLNEFSNSFRDLEAQQQNLVTRSQALLERFRKQAFSKSGQSLESLLKKVRGLIELTMGDFDTISQLSEVYRNLPSKERTSKQTLFAALIRELSGARDRLIDLDMLVEHRDLAEAHRVATQEHKQTTGLERLVKNTITSLSRRKHPRLKKVEQASSKAKQNTAAIEKILESLFPSPDEVMGDRDKKEIGEIAKQQQGIQQQAKEVQDQMQMLAEKLPLFGGEARESMQNAQQEMREASQSLKQGQLPNALGHKRQAAQQLGKLRRNLEQASQGTKGGLPLPLGGTQQRSGHGAGQDSSRGDVEIPHGRPGAGGPGFRQDLLEAAKQKPPTDYEDAVRQYYRELIQ